MSSRVFTRHRKLSSYISVHWKVTILHRRRPGGPPRTRRAKRGKPRSGRPRRPRRTRRRRGSGSGSSRRPPQGPRRGDARQKRKRRRSCGSRRRRLLRDRRRAAKLSAPLLRNRAGRRLPKGSGLPPQRARRRPARATPWQTHSRMLRQCMKPRGGRGRLAQESILRQLHHQPVQTGRGWRMGAPAWRSMRSSQPCRRLTAGSALLALTMRVPAEHGAWTTAITPQLTASHIPRGVRARLSPVRHTTSASCPSILAQCASVLIMPSQQCHPHRPWHETGPRQGRS